MALRTRTCVSLAAPFLGILCGLPAMAVGLVPQSAGAAESGTAQLSGVIRQTSDGAPIGEALVILSCTCLQESKQRRTNDNGLYAFKNLPAGIYTIQMFAGKDEKTYINVPIQRGQKLRKSVKLDPEIRSRVIVKSRENRAVSSVIVDQEEGSRLVLDPDKDAAKTAIQRHPLGDKDAGGHKIAGATSSEGKYTLNNGNTTNPTTGNVAIPTVQEFIQSVEVIAGGYAAEFGDASGFQVRARRIGGSRTMRGQARFTFTPRLARPRFILQTDNAIRATSTPDYNLQGVIAVDGPLWAIRNCEEDDDKCRERNEKIEKTGEVFWSAGMFASGGQSSLIQSFHARQDRDGSGGFSDCPYENGANDCVDGGDYIATRKFGEQKFKTGGARLQLLAGVDYFINRNHRIDFTLTAVPTFLRRSYRRPVDLSSLDPDSLGASPFADPLGGGSAVANGVVNDNFGWDRSNAIQAVANYKGRVAQDKLEIDATLSFFQTAYQEAWKLDNPELKNQVSTQQFSNDGRNLFSLLDDARRLDLAPGVRDACNDRDLPGLTCPVRSWVSGGLGQYQSTRSRRAEGAVSFTHFFNGAGSHQLKYGTKIEHVDRRRVLQYSGKNSPSFYDNCAERGLEGDGGEWCYNASGDRYEVGDPLRVDNHRLVVVNTNSPNDRTTYGFGRVRKEQGELRAISTALGSGARVPKLDETVSTQNYALYLQDRWAILSNLFLEGGVRWQMQDMRDVLGERALFIWDSVAPRAGLVYDWTDEGKSRLYGSYGWFHQNLPLSLLNRVYGGQVNVIRSYQENRCRGLSPATGEPMSDPDGQPTESCRDSGGFTTGLTEGTVVPKLRGQYDQQFQFGYDHEIVEDLVLGVSWLHRDLGRAVEDISTNGGLDFIIANPGVGVDAGDIADQQMRCDDLSARLDGLELGNDDRVAVARELQRCQFLVDAYQKVGTLFDKPVRNFDAFTFSLTKRFANNWFLSANYTFSRHIGNYDGFVDPITGAVNLGSSTQYDIPELVRNSYGPLSFNIPHRVHLDGSYTFDLDKAGRFTLGGSLRAQSGFPVSLRGGNNRYPGFPTYVLPRGSGGRVEPNYQLNLSAHYAYPLPGKLVLGFGARLFNVTNAKAVLRTDEVYTFQNTRPIAGGDLSDLKHAKLHDPGAPNDFFRRDILQPQGNYGVEASFQNPLAAQFDVQLLF